MGISDKDLVRAIMRQKQERFGRPVKEDFYISRGGTIPIVPKGIVVKEIPSVNNHSRKQFSVASKVIRGSDFIEQECDCLPWVGCDKCCPDMDVFILSLDRLK